MSTAAAVELAGVSRRFQVGGEDIWAVRDLSCRIERGEFVALIGRSGAGKTTLLNLIAGLDRATEGSVRIAGRDITAITEAERIHLRRHEIGFVFQSFGLLPLLSAEENVEIAMRIGGLGRRERVRRTAALLERVGLTGRARHRPYELSGGEQQRVAIARALANQPLLVLADEPTGELDSVTAQGIFALLRALVDDDGVTVITTTHDRTIMELAPRVEEMRDGRLLAPEEQELLSYTTHGTRLQDAGDLPPELGQTPAEPAITAPAASAPGPSEPAAPQPTPIAAAERDFQPPAGVDRPAWARPTPKRAAPR